MRSRLRTLTPDTVQTPASRVGPRFLLYVHPTTTQGHAFPKVDVGSTLLSSGKAEGLRPRTTRERVYKDHGLPTGDTVQEKDLVPLDDTQTPYPTLPLPTLRSTPEAKGLRGRYRTSPPTTHPLYRHSPPSSSHPSHGTSSRTDTYRTRNRGPDTGQGTEGFSTSWIFPGRNSREGGLVFRGYVEDNCSVSMRVWESPRGHDFGIAHWNRYLSVGLPKTVRATGPMWDDSKSNLKRFTPGP